MSVGGASRMSRVVKNETYAAFKQWFAFMDSHSNTLKIEVWDGRRSLSERDNGPVGECQIPLCKSVSEETCKFKMGQVSFIYACAWQVEPESVSEWWMMHLDKINMYNHNCVECLMSRRMQVNKEQQWKGGIKMFVFVFVCFHNVRMSPSSGP